jgi:rhamnosyltransferase subunit B
MACILITTFGSYADLHPYIAVALELRQRGHQPVIATSASYRPKVEAEGLRFHAVRPDLDDFGPFAEVARRVYNPKRGAEYLVRELMLPRLADTYDDLTAAAEGADLLVTHAPSYAAHLLARSTGLPWAASRRHRLRCALDARAPIFIRARLAIGTEAGWRSINTAHCPLHSCLVGPM